MRLSISFRVMRKFQQLQENLVDIYIKRGRSNADLEMCPGKASIIWAHLTRTVRARFEQMYYSLLWKKIIIYNNKMTSRKDGESEFYGKFCYILGRLIR